MLTFGCTVYVKSIACVCIVTNLLNPARCRFWAWSLCWLPMAREGVATVNFRPSGILGEGNHIVFLSSAACACEKSSGLKNNHSLQILGEKLVLAANGKDGLATVALRPSGIFGEGDPLLVPTTVAKAKQGKMGFIIGNGENLMEFTYAGNVAQAHLQVSHVTAHMHKAALPFCGIPSIAVSLPV